MRFLAKNQWWVGGLGAFDSLSTEGDRSNTPNYGFVYIFKIFGWIIYHLNELVKFSRMISKLKSLDAFGQNCDQNRFWSSCVVRLLDVLGIVTYTGFFLFLDRLRLTRCHSKELRKLSRTRGGRSWSDNQGPSYRLSKFVKIEGGVSSTF